MIRPRTRIVLTVLFLCPLSSESSNYASAGSNHAQVTKLRHQIESEEVGLSRLIRDFELSCWLNICRGNVDEACRSCIEKARWRAKIGSVKMQQVAKAFESDGYSVCLEGLRDLRGAPIVYSFGLPRGKESYIRSQTMYMQERVLAEAGARSTLGGICAPLTVIDCRSPSFRSPEAALRRGGIDVVAKYYPWASEGRTVFVGLPKPLKGLISVARPFFPKKLYDRFEFVNDYEGLLKYIAPDQIPESLGGTKKWALHNQVQSRCFLEGGFCQLNTSVELGFRNYERRRRAAKRRTTRRRSLRRAARS